MKLKGWKNKLEIKTLYFGTYLDFSRKKTLVTGLRVE
jgi:hypothetical protein